MWGADPLTLPYCCKSILSEISSKIQSVINVSATLAKQSDNDTGLNLSHFGGLVFGMGTTMAFFHCVGTTPSA